MNSNDKKLRIAVITTSFPRHPGDGTGSFIYSLSKALTASGHEVRVYTPDSPLKRAKWPRTPNLHVKWVRYIYPLRWAKLGYAQSMHSDVQLKWHAYPLVFLFSIAALWSLRKDARKFPFDIIYAQWLMPGGFIGLLASYLLHRPLVVHLHGSDVFVAEKHSAFRPIVRMIAQRACRILACSRNLRQRGIHLGLSPHRTLVIPYGVDIGRYRRSQPLHSSTPVVMAMGRLVHKKGFPYFLKAAALVHQRHPNIQFILGGDGDLREELTQMVQQLNAQEYIHLTGHIPWHETPQALSQAEIFVVPSIQDASGNVDGLPNVLLEAMASGCAVIATSVGGITEVIHDGINGLLVPPNDEQKLADAILKLVETPSPRKTLGKQAADDVALQYSWNAIATQVAHILLACRKGN